MRAAVGLNVSGGPAILDNTIVALNTDGRGSGAPADDIADTSQVSLNSAYNLIGTGGADGLINGINGNGVGVADPDLGALADNGGPTQTITLLPGSPAIGPRARIRSTASPSIGISAATSPNRSVEHRCFSAGRSGVVAGDLLDRHPFTQPAEYGRVIGQRRFQPADQSRHLR